MSVVPFSPFIYSFGEVLFKRWQADISVIKYKMITPEMKKILKSIQNMFEMAE